MGYDGGMESINFDKQKLEKACRKHGVVAVYVHGSRVKGYAASDSDTDVAVVVEDRKKQERGSFSSYNVAGEIEEVLKVKNPDVRVVDSDSSPVFLFEVIKGGKLIYEKNVEIRIDFESMVMQRYYNTAKMHDIYRKYLYSDLKETYANK